jgi:hypothetical protein
MEGRLDEAAVRQFACAMGGTAGLLLSELHCHRADAVRRHLRRRGLYPALKAPDAA